jgi:hypothetical protein
MARYIDILLKEPPGREACFIEVENESRHSVSFEDWVRRDDGYWALRIRAADIENAPSKKRVVGG